MFTSVLMIEQPLSAPDVEFVTTLHGDEPVSFVLLMQPRGDQDRLLRAIDDVALGELGEAVREAEEPEGEVDGTPAARALEHSLRALRAAGSEAEGRLVEDEPLAALTALVAETGADEVIVLTEPHYVEEFFHRDWATRARHKVGVPVLKLYSHAPADGADAPTGASSDSAGPRGSGATAAGTVSDQDSTGPASRTD